MKRLERILSLVLLLALMIPLVRMSSGMLPSTGGSVGTEFSGRVLDENGVRPTGEPPVTGGETAETPPQRLDADPDREFRGVWVSTVLNLDYPSAPGLSAEAMQAEADTILDRCADLGFNAVLLQVRPCGDALYQSDCYPWSAYLTGTQGKDPGFDPLEYWVEGAHARGLELHAWVNPFRVARQSHDLSALAANNPARLHPEWTVQHTDGNMYLDPGYPEVRELVAGGMREIVTRYGVDGIHFDDYFYPDGGMDDDASYERFGGGMDRGDWRRSNINALIRAVHAVAQEAGVPFGVSPFGIWRNASRDERGSATNGNESYSSHYADTRLWVKEGMVDYIAPQLYWAIGYEAADYAVLARWWADVVRNTGVRLYIGQAAYRCGNSSSSSAWYGTRQLRRQFEVNEQYPEISGTIQFRYAFFLTYAPLGSFIRSRNNAAELPADYPRLGVSEWDGELVVGRPEEDIAASVQSYYILGRCNPSEPLLLNGEPVSGVTEDGYFGAYVSLVQGTNVFRFTQSGQTVTRVITRKSVSAAAAEPLEAPVIVPGSAYPYDDDICVRPGEKITLRCTAPIGAEVTATLAGETYKLSPNATKPPANDGKVYGTQYGYTITVGKDYAPGSLHTVGRPVYTLTYKEKETSVSAGGLIQCIGDGAPFYATPSGNAAFLYSKSSTSGGPVGELPAGMYDYITAVTTGGSWIRLASGYWVQKQDVKKVHGAGPLKAGLSAAEYTVGKDADRLRLTAAGMAFTSVERDDLTLTLKVRNAESAPALTLPQGSMFSACAQWCENGIAYYKLTFREAGVFDGFWLEADGSAITLVAKRRPHVSEGPLPLTGITVMLDAGHGGPEKGAAGPLGLACSERVVVLNQAEKIKYELEAKGAAVLMTRTDDSLVELTDRVVIARDAKPDLFLSIHADAVDVTVNAADVAGVSSWYRSDIAGEFAALLAEYTAGALGVRNRGAKYANYYVCRGEFCPCALLECGFMCSPGDFGRLTDDAAQATLARAVCDVVCEYFK